MALRFGTPRVGDAMRAWAGRAARRAWVTPCVRGPGKRHAARSRVRGRASRTPRVGGPRRWHRVGALAQVASTRAVSAAMSKSAVGYSSCIARRVSTSTFEMIQSRCHLWLAGTQYQGEPTVEHAVSASP